jgi:rhodanese-related sulfurtransferase
MKSRSWGAGLIARSALIVVASSLVGLGYNAVRADSLDLVAESDYEIYEECPEGEEVAEPIHLDELKENPDYFFLVDSRTPDEYEQGHAPGAFSVPYDPLFPVSEEEIDSVRTAAGDRTIVVVGDSLTAKLLANDLLNQGISFVQYLDEGEDWRSLVGGAGD